MHEEFEEHPRNPLWYVVGIFMVALIVLMIVPAAIVGVNPEPTKTVSLEEVQERFNFEAAIQDRERWDIASLVKVDAQTKAIADYIVSSSCPGFDRVCYAKSIFYFVRDEFRYVQDPAAFEYVKTLPESIISGGGDCDDSTVGIASLLQAVGFKVRLVFVPRHVYVEAYIPEAVNRYKRDGGWVVLDGTCASCDFGELALAYAGAEKRYVDV